MGPGDGEQMGEAARAKRLIVLRVEVRFAENEGARHRRSRGHEGRLDATARARAQPIDRSEHTPAATDEANVLGAATRENAAASAARTRIRQVVVPEELHRGERRDELDLVAAGKV